MLIVNRFGLHGNASVIYRTKPFTVRVIRPSMRLEVRGIHGLGCWLGAGGQDSKTKIEERLMVLHRSSLSANGLVFCVLSRDTYTIFLYFYAILEPALALRTYFLQFLTRFLENLVLGSVCAKKFSKKL